MEYSKYWQQKGVSNMIDIVGRGLAPAEIQFTPYGKIAKEQLLLLEDRYPTLKIDQYVIMPNHIHAILILVEPAGASPRPTVNPVVFHLPGQTILQRHSRMVLLDYTTSVTSLFRSFRFFSRSTSFSLAYPRVITSRTGMVRPQILRIFSSSSQPRIQVLSPWAVASAVR